MQVASQKGWNSKHSSDDSTKTKCTTNKSILIDYIIDNNLSNDEEYNNALSDEVLCTLERKAAPTQLRSIKELAYAQVIARRLNISYEEHITPIECPDHVKGPMLTWLESIAHENNETLDELIVRIFNVLCGRDSKKRGLILIGLSDSGKSMFANLHTAFYERSEIGYFSAPGQYCSPFWLSKLVGKSMYRGDEIVLENVEPMQKFKQLTEGRSNLETDVKYKAAQRINVNPSITTCNRENTNDFYKHMNHEEKAIKNRCEFVFMGRSLTKVIPYKCIARCVDNSQAIIYNAFN